MKPNVLIINKSQFGYHTDTFYYCKYLSDNFNVTYLCFDENNKKQKISNVNVIYVCWKGSFFYKAFNFFKEIYKEINLNKYHLIFVVNFSFCFITRFFNLSANFILDLRTGSVRKSPFSRFCEDFMTKINFLFFKHKTIISKSLANQFKVQKYTELPLGSEIISSSNKNFDYLKLLYVGTFSNRRIIDTLKALEIFVNKNLSNNLICYTIVGFGTKEEEINISKAIIKFNLSHIVNFVGRVSLDKLEKYFDTHNVGVAYIPQTNYFDCQPSTKIFEYSLSGLITIATNTAENRKYINKFNGLICEDNSLSLYHALESVSSNLKSFNSNDIRSNFLIYTWKKIVANILRKKIKEIIYK